MFTRVSIAGLLIAVALVCGARSFAQNTAKQTWPEPVWKKPPITDQNRKPAPRRNLTGLWGPAGGSDAGTQAGGVQLRPNNASPENQLPYTPLGLSLYKSHKPLEGPDAVLPADHNDPRNYCEPLGIPRYNHYNLRLVQFFQDEYKVMVAYQYDSRWRVIWTDGRPLPKLLDGGVEIDGGFRESRWFGYSVDKWLDDNTFEVQTVGTMPENRVWLDSTGRPLSDQVTTTETFRRSDYDNMEWSETISDPKTYTMPWQTMRMPMRLHDPRTEIMEQACSPLDYQTYMRLFATPASGKR